MNRPKHNTDTAIAHFMLRIEEGKFQHSSRPADYPISWYESQIYVYSKTCTACGTRIGMSILTLAVLTDYSVVLQCSKITHSKPLCSDLVSIN